MPVDSQQVMQEADKLGQLIAQHPAVARYRQAQKAVTEDAEAPRLMAEFERQLEALARQEHAGSPVTDAQRSQLEALQSRIASHIKIKNLNQAQVEFVDLLRRVSQAIQRHAVEGSAPPTAPTPAGPRVVVQPRA